MEKKSVAATFLVLILTTLFSVIGICFSVYKYQDTKIEIKEVKIATKGVSVYGDKELKEKTTKLKLSDMQLGLKPATGELDSESQIPSTVTNEGTSEGYYATVYVPAGTSFKIFVTDIIIDTKHNKDEADHGRKDVFVAIKDLVNTTKTIEKDRTEIVKIENVKETQEFTFLIWLGPLAGKELVGAKISFTLSFEAI